MAETNQGAQIARTTIPVILGTKESPLKVVKGSTGFEGIKGGQTKGTLFLEVIMSQSAVDAFESIPQIAELINGTKAEFEAHNAPIKEKIAKVPEAVQEQLKKELKVYVDYKTIIIDPQTYEPVLNNKQEKQYIVKFKQTSLAKQIANAQSAAASKPGTKAPNLYYVKHYVLDSVTQKMKFLKNADGNPVAHQTFEGGEILVQVNTKIEQYPSELKFTLTLNRMTSIYHLVEGTPSGSNSTAINDFGFEIEDEIVEDENTKATSREETKTSNKPSEEEDAYAETTSEKPADKPANKEENPYE